MITSAMQGVTKATTSNVGLSELDPKATGLEPTATATEASPELRPVDFDDLANVVGKNGDAPGSSGAIARRLKLDESMDPSGLKPEVAIATLAALVKGWKEPPGWIDAPLPERLMTDRVLGEVRDPSVLLPNAAGELQTEVPLVRALLDAVKSQGMDEYADGVKTKHRYLELLVLLTQGHDTPKVTELASLLLEQRLALLDRRSHFGEGTYRPPHDELLSGYILAVREHLFLPSLVRIAAQNQFKGEFAEKLLSAVRDRTALQHELSATLSNGLASAPPLAVAYLRHLARSGVKFAALDPNSGIDSPQNLILRKVLDPAYEITGSALIAAARSNHRELDVDRILTANGVRVDADVLREATDSLVVPRLLWDPGSRHNVETIQRLIPLAEVPDHGPKAKDLVVAQLRQKYGPQAEAPRTEADGNRRLAGLYTLGQLGELTKADVDRMVAEMLSQVGLKVAKGETTLLAFFEELLRRGSNVQGRDQQPMVVLRKKLGKVLADQGVTDLPGLGRYLVEQHNVKPKVLDASTLNSLAELFNLHVRWNKSGPDLSALTASIERHAAARAAREATLSFKVRAAFDRWFG